MSAATSNPPSPGVSDMSETPSTSQPAEALSATSAAASGTLDSSAFQKERRSSISMKRHHDDDVDYEKEDSRDANGDADDDEDSNRMLRETRTSNTTTAAAADTGDAVMTHSPVPKKKRISVQLPEQIRAQKQRDAAAAAAAAGGDGFAGDMVPPKPERTSSTTSASPPTTPHTPIARRLSMTEDQKRASFTSTIARALQSSYPLSPSPTPPPPPSRPHPLHRHLTRTIALQSTRRPHSRLHGSRTRHRFQPDTQHAARTSDSRRPCQHRAGQWNELEGVRGR